MTDLLVSLFVLVVLVVLALLMLAGAVDGRPAAGRRAVEGRVMTDLLVSLFVLVVLVVLALLMLAGAESHPVRALARYEAPRMTAAMLAARGGRGRAGELGRAADCERR